MVQIASTEVELSNELPPRERPRFKENVLQPWEIPAIAFAGTPCYDEDLKVGQNRAHRIMVYELGTVLAAVAQEAGLAFLSDEPIWYLHPESDEQRIFYGDWVIARGEVDRKRVIATDLVLVVEIVSTHYRKKEIKDTGFQYTVNEYNGVAEFGLVFPDAKDARSLQWYRLEDGRYQEIPLSPAGEVASTSFPGLVLQVRPQAEWADGHKLKVYYQGEHRRTLKDERARAERLAARLRELGLDPD